MQQKLTKYQLLYLLWERKSKDRENDTNDLLVDQCAL